jgi:hypothetical protein
MKPQQKKLSGLRIKQQALYVMIFSFVTVVVWISGSLFRSQKRTGISPDLLQLAVPLSPTINVDVIDRIEQSTVYSDQELYDFQIYKLIKSKDGRIQQVVPIGSNLNEIPEEEIKIVVKEEPLEDLDDIEDRISEQTNLDDQLDTGSGTFSPELEDAAVPAPAGEREILPPHFGEDGLYYLD